MMMRPVPTVTDTVFEQRENMCLSVALSKINTQLESSRTSPERFKLHQKDYFGVVSRLHRPDFKL